MNLTNQIYKNIINHKHLKILAIKSTKTGRFIIYYFIYECYLFMDVIMFMNVIYLWMLLCLYIHLYNLHLYNIHL